MNALLAGSAARGWESRDLAAPCDVWIDKAGLLPIPAAARALLDLVEGDVLFLEKGVGSLVLVPSREALRRLRRWGEWTRRLFLSKLRRQPVMVLDGAARIPRRVFPLAAGERLVLKVQDHDLGPAIFLFQGEPLAAEKKKSPPRRGATGWETRGMGALSRDQCP